MRLVESKIPPPSAELRRRGIELALADLAKYGVTSAQDNSAWEDFLTYRAIKNDGKLTVRITEWLPFAAPLEKLEQLRRDGGTTDPWLRTGALKLVADGALGSRTAAMLAPYSDDPSTSGIMTMEPEKIKTLAIERDKAGFQLNFHAIGDRTNRVALDAFEAAAKANGPRDRRDRIEHAQVVALSDFPRFARLQVIASMQPSHETSDMRWAEQRVGPERIKGAYAWATMQKFGIRLAFGTDYDVEPITPFRGLYACVTRELPDGGPQGGWQPQEKISLEDCIRAYTSGSAWRIHGREEGRIKGWRVCRLHRAFERPHQGRTARVHQDQSAANGGWRPHRLHRAVVSLHCKALHKPCRIQAAGARNWRWRSARCCGVRRLSS